MTKLYKTISATISKSLARGKFETENSAIYFFLCEFVNMSNQVFDSWELCVRVIELHRNSVSSIEKFEFHVRTCNDRTSQIIEWDSSWTSFFIKFMIHVMNKDFKINESWSKLEKVENRIVFHVILRLIEALKKDERSVKSCLIHADLWKENIDTSYKTKEIVLFDAESYYAHNEMKIGDWRCSYNKVNFKIYIKTYLRHYDMSEFTKNWDDRNRLYSVYFNIIYSVNHMLKKRSVWQM